MRYATPPGSSPVWSRAFDFGSVFFGIAATNEGVYAGGWNYSLTNDPVGGKEVKTFLAKFAPDGTSGPGPGGSTWVTGGPGNLGPFFAFSGVENFQGVATAVEGGSTFLYATGGGEPCSQRAYIVAKYGTAGNFVAAATDSTVGVAFNQCFAPSPGGSSSDAVTVLNGNVYLAGIAAWAHEGDFPNARPAVYKYDPNLNLLWRRKDNSLAGTFQGLTGFGNAIYAVGNTFVSGVPGSENYLIQKYDEAGNLVWSQTSGGAGTDVLTGVVGIGSRLFAVGRTNSSGAGGFDVAVLEIDPATGATLSTTLFGGVFDDKANGAATDGTDLYVVGESRSFASAEGNIVGQNDVMLLRYTFGPVGPGAPATLTLAPKAAANTVGTTHCVTATVKDAAGNPVPGVTVRFSVPTAMATHATPSSGSDVTDSSGEATFCYSASLPGQDAIHAFADTDDDGQQDAGEPFDDAAKTWTPPVSTAFCEVTITNGGWIVANNGDRASFGGNAKVSADGSTVQGQQQYTDHGPAQPMNVHSIELTATTCNDDLATATIFGTATIDGSGMHVFRIDVIDMEQGGTSDSYGITLSNGYVSGQQQLGGGNVTIHK